MKTKQTQGEWIVEGNCLRSKTHYCDTDVNNGLNTIPMRGAIAIVNDAIISEETAANAKLIASAPDLLEALKAARGLIYKQRGDTLTVMDMIQQALNKATS